MSANVPEGSDWWEGWLWVRDTAGNITSMANFLFKQQRLFKLAKKKNTAHWGLNNSDVWWRQRNFACVFHKLESLSLTPLQNKSSQNTFFSFNLLVLPGDKKKTDRHSVTSSGEEFHYSNLNSTIHQTDSGLGIILSWGLTSVYLLPVSSSLFFTSAMPMSVSQRAEQLLITFTASSALLSEKWHFNRKRWDRLAFPLSSNFSQVTSLNYYPCLGWILSNGVLIDENAETLQKFREEKVLYIDKEDLWEKQSWLVRL